MSYFLAYQKELADCDQFGQLDEDRLLVQFFHCLLDSQEAKLHADHWVNVEVALAKLETNHQPLEWLDPLYRQEICNGQVH